ncbi:hypothetical protein FQR65_LT17076 [Abscondita terminalis]|nr:hypothetical protein FQR65_LT17076 [Abscondita terminalis]
MYQLVPICFTLSKIFSQLPTDLVANIKPKHLANVESMKFAKIYQLMVNIGVYVTNMLNIPIKILAQYWKIVRIPYESVIISNSLAYSARSTRNTPTPHSLEGSQSSQVVASFNVKTQLTNIKALDNQKRINHISAIIAQGRSVSELCPSAEFHILQTIEETKNFEKKLEDSKYFSEMVAYFNEIGGRDYKDTVRNILRKLFITNFCKRYNWCGRGEKENFNQYKNILQLILGVTRKQNSASTFNGIDDVMKIWLRNARNRDGGRNEPRKKQNTLETSDA